MCNWSPLDGQSSVRLDPYVIHFAVAPPEPWIAMEGVQLGPFRAGERMPNLHGLVEQDGLPLMRLGLYERGSCSDFRDAVALWKRWLVIAYCDHLYMVSLRTNMVHDQPLEGYFGSLKGLADYLLIADARRLLCFDEQASLLWSVDPGIDGVVFDVLGEVVVGEAEIDPPGGWVPFRLSLQSGERLHREENAAKDRSG